MIYINDHKTKKMDYPNNLKSVIKNINTLKKTNRITVVDEPFQKMPSIYLENIDVVVGILAFMPTGILEFAIYGKRPFFYDYFNLNSYDLYIILVKFRPFIMIFPR